MSLSYDQLVSLAAGAGFSASAAQTAAAIALAESGGNPDATHGNSNGSTDYGLWQINSVHGNLLRGKNWQDPATNASMAYTVYRDAAFSFTPWSTYNSGAYKAHMNGNAAVNGQGANAAGFSIPNPLSLLSGAGNVASAAGHLLGNLIDPNFWKRIGFGILGVLVLIVGLIFLVEQSKTGRTLTKAAVV